MFVLADLASTKTCYNCNKILNMKIMLHMCSPHRMMWHTYPGPYQFGSSNETCALFLLFLVFFFPDPRNFSMEAERKEKHETGKKSKEKAQRRRGEARRKKKQERLTRAANVG